MSWVIYMLIWLFARPIQGVMFLGVGIHKTIENLREANKHGDH